jgi:pyridinium-3,5-bisthiocarboxylic acid mononucleotide nickel chelatase
MTADGTPSANTQSARRIAWFNCFSGIAGDMTLGSLVDAGADSGELARMLQRIPIGGWSLEFEPVLRNGLGATRAVVTARDDGVVRTFMHILGMLEEARLPARVRTRSVGAFSALAAAEGRLHRRPAAQVHFHEVGGHDAIVDVVGSAIALELLEIDVGASSPVVNGSGIVRTSHGVLPNPAPAVVELLRGIPTIGRDVNVELTTPTGAAMLRAWGSHFGPIPAMTIEASGFGAGAQDLDDIPNCTQVVIGTSTTPATSITGQSLVVLESNLDDATGETLAHAISRLMDSGALDAWLQAVVMKRGRPGHVLSVLCEPVLARELAAVMAAETGTLGVRASGVERWTSTREPEVVEVEGLPVRIKVSPGRIKAEHSDAARVAGITGLPLIEVAARAEAAYRTAAPRPEDMEDLRPPPPGA